MSIILKAFIFLQLLHLHLSGGNLFIDVPLLSCDGPDSLIIGPTEPDPSTALNSPSKSVFCLTPGTYSAPINLLTSGNHSVPRYIRYYDPSNPDQIVAPWKQTEQEKVLIVSPEFIFRTGHWIVEGLTFRPPSGSFVLIYDGAHNIVLHRVLLEEGQKLLKIGGTGTHSIPFNNTLQNSVLSMTNTKRKIMDDHPCIVTGRTHHNRFLSNEFINCGDAFHFWNNDVDVEYNLKGTIIEGNDIYITSDIYADCLNSDPISSINPSGGCACAENGVDFKIGVRGDNPPPEDIIHIRDNNFHGFRHTHISCGGTGDAGYAIVTHHLEADYILIENNRIFNSQCGIAVDGDSNHVTVRNNVFFDILDFDGEFRDVIYVDSSGNTHSASDTESVATAWSGQRSEFFHNTIIGNTSRNPYVDQYYLRYGGRHSSFLNNLYLDGGEFTVEGNWEASLNMGYNSFYDAPTLSSLLNFSSNLVAPSSSAHMSDYCFTIKIHTDPEEYCIPNAIPTQSSPHVDKGYPNPGDVLDMGINDIVGVPFDLLGNPRDSIPDIGAFEFV